MMLRLFRNIRQKLIEQEKMRKYLWYALGEILLVMIGILLALQVNNWNEARKNNNDIQIILSSIQQDLLNDIREFTLGYEWYKRQDTLSTQLIEGRFSANDSSDDVISEMYQVGRRDYPLKLSDTSYRQLIDQKEKVPENYREILLSLSSIYEEDYHFHSKAQNALETFSYEYDEYLHTTFDWILDIQGNNTNKDATEYFLSKAHSQRLLYFRSLLRTDFGYAFRIRDKAIFSYLVIRHTLEDHSPFPDILIKYGVPEHPPETLYDVILKPVTNLEQSGNYHLKQEFGQLLIKNLNEKNNFYYENILVKEIEADSLAMVHYPEFTMKINRNAPGDITGATTYLDGKKDIDYTVVE